MRKIEREMIEAIKAKKDYIKDNTYVLQMEGSQNKEVTLIHLNDYIIAKVVGNELWLSDCGYQTNTTKSRLNSILNAFNLPTIGQRNYQWYIGQEKWKGDKTFLLSEQTTLEPQPKSTDAVLGGQSQQPRPYDAVLGGKK